MVVVTTVTQGDELRQSFLYHFFVHIPSNHNASENGSVSSMRREEEIRNLTLFGSTLARVGHELRAS